MKKFIIALLLIISLNSHAFAASSDDVYVRRDVFDVHMLNINQNLQRIINDIQSLKFELQAQRNDINELAKVTAVLSARIDGVNTRIDDLRNGLYLWLVVIGTFIAWPKAKDFFQNRAAQRKFLTLQDVEKLIDSKLNAKSQ